MCRDATILYFNAPFFCCSSFSSLRLESTKWLAVLINTLFFFKISFKDTTFHIYLNSIVLYLSPECLLNFLKISKFMVLTFLENALTLSIFTHVLPPHSKRSPKLLSIHPRQRKIAHSLFEINHCLFKLSSIALSWVITAIMFFIQCYSCVVMLLGLFSKKCNYILIKIKIIKWRYISALLNNN